MGGVESGANGDQRCEAPDRHGRMMHETQGIDVVFGVVVFVDGCIQITARDELRHISHADMLRHVATEIDGQMPDSYQEAEIRR